MNSSHNGEELLKRNRRILIVDDTASIHDDIRAILSSTAPQNELSNVKALVLGTKQAARGAAIQYEIDSSYQGQDGFEKVKQARAEGRPYALAIVDIRMPPGWDGVETIEAIRGVDPDIQIAICTAYSDYSWSDIHEKFRSNDWLLILKKPFDLAEVQQLASTMTEKWHLAWQASMKLDDLKSLVEDHARQLRTANSELMERNRVLAAVNDQLSREIAARQQADDRIRHIAFHDALTDLPNRALIMERINYCIQRGKREWDYQFAVLFADIDDFKDVNDSLGHRTGDELLIQVARDLNDALRRIDGRLQPGSSTVARLGGDEFVILLDGIQGPTHVTQIATRIREALCRSRQVGGREITPSVSVGMAIVQNEYDDALDILRDADTALYQAKASRKGQAVLFDKAMRARLMARINLENDLRQAIDMNQFVIHYQPIVSLVTGQIESLEALIRWHHPARGLLSPDTFIPVAEETGLIGPIGELAIREAVRQVADWRKRFTAAANLSVSINLSTRQLGGSQLVEYINGCLSHSDLDPSAIKLEITETAMMDDLEVGRELIHTFRSHGIETYLDDFGTGYSSLSILHTLPFSALKVDRSFVRDLREVENETTIQAIIMLAKNRNIKLIAEGIETFDQLAQLKELDCEYGQGYYFSKPVAAREVEELLAGGLTYCVATADTLESPDLDGDASRATLAVCS